MVSQPGLSNLFVSQNPRKFYKSHFFENFISLIFFCIYHLFVRSNLNFWHNSQLITFPTHSCQVLYFFCASWLHSLIMWLILLCLSQRNLQLHFCYFWSIINVIQFVLMALLWAAVRRDLISPLRFYFVNHYPVFLSEISLVCRLKYPYSCFSAHLCF